MEIAIGLLVVFLLGGFAGYLIHRPSCDVETCPHKWLDSDGSCVCCGRQIGVCLHNET
jgi:hypothetical protein